MSRGKKLTQLLIAVDGPAGSGKSSVSQAVARELGLSYLDTGAMYRAATYFCLEKQLDLSELKTSEIEKIFEREFKLRITKEQKIFLNGQELKIELRQTRINQLVSTISANPVIRKLLLTLQRELGANGGVILDGRDIGTTVFPQADLKIFLTAKPEERARRRALQENSKNTLAIQEELKERDRLDESRKISPLKMAKDAILIETDNLSFLEVIEQIKQLAISLVSD